MLLPPGWAIKKHPPCVFLAPTFKILRQFGQKVSPHQQQTSINRFLKSDSEVGRDTFLETSAHANFVNLELVLLEGMVLGRVTVPKRKNFPTGTPLNQTWTSLCLKTIFLVISYSD